MTALFPPPVYFELERTATYSRRRIGWFPAAFAAHRLGTLRIILELEGRSRDATEVDVYAVQERNHLYSGRFFLLLNETDDSQEDVYEVTAVGGHVIDCTCPAGRVKVHRCKHADSVTRLLAERLL